MKNRTLPVDTLIPHVFYRDVVEASEWLKYVFGFTEQFRYGDPVSGAQVRLGDAFVMLKRAPDSWKSPAELGFSTQHLTIFVSDVDAHYARTHAEDAQIVEELHETVYGERQYGVADFAGHLWLFSQHVRDLSPSDWGAQARKIRRM